MTGAIHDPHRPVRFALRAPRRHRADALRPAVRAPAVVDLRRCRQDPPLQSADARADAGARRWRGADREPRHARLSRQPRAGRARGCFRPPSRRGTRRSRSPRSATGMADKAVSLFYEKGLHKEMSEVWVDALPHADIRRARGARGRPRRRGRATTGSASASAMPISRSRPRCASSREAHAGLVAMARFPALGRARGAARGAAGVPDDQPAVHPAGLNFRRGSNRAVLHRMRTTSGGIR